MSEAQQSGGRVMSQENCLLNSPMGAGKSVDQKIAELGSLGLADSCVGEDGVSEGAERRCARCLPIAGKKHGR